jgi:hypothetical protein
MDGFVASWLKSGWLTLNNCTLAWKVFATCQTCYLDSTISMACQSQKLTVRCPHLKGKRDSKKPLSFSLMHWNRRLDGIYKSSDAVHVHTIIKRHIDISRAQAYQCLWRWPSAAKENNAATTKLTRPHHHSSKGIFFETCCDTVKRPKMLFAIKPIFWGFRFQSCALPHNTQHGGSSRFSLKNSISLYDKMYFSFA